jgi:hypothetical protein
VQVTAVLVVDKFDVVELIIILKTGKGVFGSKGKQSIKNLTGSQGIPAYFRTPRLLLKGSLSAKGI